MHKLFSRPSIPYVILLTASVATSHAKLPISFEPNLGQADKQVKFLSRSRDYGLFLTSTEAVLVTTGPQGTSVLKTKLLGSDSKAEVAGIDPLPGKVNYFRGSDPRKWQADIPTYARVRYREVYRGIDLVYHGRQGQLEYDFIVNPGANPKAITLGFEGVESLDLTAAGDLALRTPGGTIVHHRPLIYQEIAGARREISGGYVIKGATRVGFQVDRYDSRQALVIDPTLAFSTYLGGSGEDLGRAIALDATGNIYVAGSTTSHDFPTANALQPVYRGGVCRFDSPRTFPCPDVFVAKLNPTGSALLYATYLGGSDSDEAFGIAVDAAGNAYVTGTTRSSNFPTANAFQPRYGGTRTDLFGGDAFVTKLSPTGSVLYSTYLGGTLNDIGYAIAVDSRGNAYVTGAAASRDFPLVRPLQATHGGALDDVFVAKLDPTGAALLYSTFLGGNGRDNAFGIAVDSAGNAYITGFTGSTDFPTANAIQAAHAGGSVDAFVAKLNPAGSGLVYSTYLGGSNSDEGRAIAVDSAGNAYVTGATTSTNFPTAIPFQPANRGACFEIGRAHG